MSSYSVTCVGGEADVMSRFVEAWEEAGKPSAFTSDQAIAKDPFLASEVFDLIASQAR